MSRDPRLFGLRFHRLFALVKIKGHQHDNGDGDNDVVLIGNDFGNEVFVGRLDAMTGLIMKNDGHGKFAAVPSESSGFYVPNDAKALVAVYDGKANEFIVASQNNDSLRVFKVLNKNDHLFLPKPNDFSIELTFDDGRKEKIELYYGAGYLSQPSRRLKIPTGVKEMKVTDFTWKTRDVTLPLSTK